MQRQEGQGVYITSCSLTFQDFQGTLAGIHTTTYKNKTQKVSSQSTTRQYTAKKASKDSKDKS